MIQIPMMTSTPGLASEVHGIVDLVEEKALYFDDPMGTVVREEDIPQEYRALAEDKRQVSREVLSRWELSQEKRTSRKSIELWLRIRGRLDCVELSR